MHTGMSTTVIVVASVIATIVPCVAVTRHVPAEFPTIQDAMDSSSSGDTVLVAPGHYSHWQNRVVDGFTNTFCVFMTDGVELRSEAGPDVTTIDGGSMNGLQPNTVLVRNASSPLTRIEGFTITTSGVPVRGVNLHGRMEIQDCRFVSLRNTGGSGAGINVNGDVTLLDCTFLDCQAGTGGAIYHANGVIEMSGCSVIECGSPAVLLDEGAGPPAESVLIEGCLFENNGDDGAISATYIVRPITIRNSVFRGNVENQSGGGALEIGGIGSKLIEGCVFDSNEAVGANGTGGGLLIQGPGLIRGNTFWRNGAYTPAGGSATSFLEGVNIVLQANIVAEGVGQGGAIYPGISEVTSACNVFWNNAGGPSGEGFTPGPTDREVDPQLCNPEGGDFTLDSASPCLPENSLGCGLIGAFGQGCGTVSIEPRSWGAIKGSYRNESEAAE